MLQALGGRSAIEWQAPFPATFHFSLSPSLQFPSMKKALEFQAHNGEIEDIALSPDNKVQGLCSWAGKM